MTDAQRLQRAIDNDPELVQRLLMVAEPRGKRMVGDSDAYAIMAPLVAGYPEERLAVAALDSRMRVISTAVLTIGSTGFTVVCPRQIFRWALLQGTGGAHAVILAHNHPSGDPNPSENDRLVTRRVAAAGRVVGIDLADHIVVGAAGLYTSLAAEGECG